MHVSFGIHFASHSWGRDLGGDGRGVAIRRDGR
jgi:hypothetical protein